VGDDALVLKLGFIQFHYRCLSIVDGCIRTDRGNNWVTRKMEKGKATKINSSRQSLPEGPEVLRLPGAQSARSA